MQSQQNEMQYGQTNNFASGFNYEASNFISAIGQNTK